MHALTVTELRVLDLAHRRYAVMCRCWQGDPNLRPGFRDIAKDLEVEDPAGHTHGSVRGARASST